MSPHLSLAKSAGIYTYAASGAARRNDRPADVTLFAWRAFGASAYRCDADSPNRWCGTCPCCEHPSSLTVSEAGHGGPVTLRCARGCHEERVAQALERGPQVSTAGNDQHPLDDELLALAMAAVDEVHRLRAMLADAVTENAA